jgi:hypothetical protein
VTSEDVKSVIDKRPFRPVRFHLVSGKTIDVTESGQPYMLQNAVMIVPNRTSELYDVIALRNIERLELLE